MAGRLGRALVPGQRCVRFRRGLIVGGWATGLVAMDLARGDELLSAAEAADRCGRPREALALLEEALALCRGGEVAAARACTVRVLGCKARVLLGLGSPAGSIEAYDELINFGRAGDAPAVAGMVLAALAKQGDHFA